MEPIMVLVAMVVLTGLGFLAGVEYQRGNTTEARDSGDRNAIVLANALCEALDQADREKAKLYKQGILDERERCARIAEGQATMMIPHLLIPMPVEIDAPTRTARKIARMIRDQPVKDRPDTPEKPCAGLASSAVADEENRAMAVFEERQRCRAIVKAALVKWRREGNQAPYKPGIVGWNPKAGDISHAIADALDECLKLIERE